MSSVRSEHILCSGGFLQIDIVFLFLTFRIYHIPAKEHLQELDPHLLNLRNISFQSLHNEIKKELDRLLQAQQETHSPHLAEDEVTAVKRNLQTNNVEATPAEVSLTSIVEKNQVRIGPSQVFLGKGILEYALINRRTPMPNYEFYKVALQLY